jgi:hypothetical protein
MILLLVDQPEAEHGVSDNTSRSSRYPDTLRQLVDRRRRLRERTKRPISLTTKRCFAAMKPSAIRIIGSGVASAITGLPIVVWRRVSNLSNVIQAEVG